MVFLPPNTHSILILLSMVHVYQTLIFWPQPNHGISNPLSMVSWTPTDGKVKSLPMEYWTPYPWYTKPHTNGISTPYTWYFEPPIHGILNPLFWYYGLNLWFNLPWWGSKYYDRNLAPLSKYHIVYWPPGWFFRGSKYHMTPVFSVVCVAQYLILFLFFGRLLYPFVIFFLLAIILSIIWFMAPLIFSNCSYLLHVVLFFCSEWFFLIIAKTRT